MTAPDVTTTVAPESVPETQAPAPETAVVEVDKKTEGPLSRREAQEALQQDLAARRQQRATEEAKKAEETPPAEGADAASTAAATDAAAAAARSAQKAEEVAKPVRIALPDGHSLRQMGIDGFTASTPQEERAIRALLNSYNRRAELVTMTQERDTLRLHLAERDAREEAWKTWETSPEHQAVMKQYEEIKDSFGQETADRFLRGEQIDFEKLVEEKLDVSRQAITQERIAKAAENWTSEAWERTGNLPKTIRDLPRFSEMFEQAVQSFDAEIALGHLPQDMSCDQMHKEFMAFFGSRLTKEKDVVDVVRRQTEQTEQQKRAAAAKAAEVQRQRELAGKEAVENYRREQAAKRTGAPPHPLGNLPARSREPAPAGTEAAAPAAASLSPQEIRRQAREGARQDARRRFTGP